MKEFDRIIGYEPIKNELKRICDILVNPDKYKKFGVRAPQGLLLYGEPGVGKSLMADCFIKASKRKAYVFRKVKMGEDFVESISKLFEEAKKNAPSIILLDDMDKFANEDEEHRDAPEYVAIQACIDYLKKSDVFVVATANDIKSFPESLVRVGRFSKCIEIERPEGKDCEQIMQHYLSKKKHVGRFDYAEFAKTLNGMTCAELESIINEAGIYAAYEGKEKIGKDEMIRACMRVMYKAPEDSLSFSKNPNEIKRLAYHEAGHVVVAEVLNDESISLVSIASHLGSIGGVTKNYFDDDKCWINHDFRIGSVKRVLGGKAATEVVFGEIDLGAESDIGIAFHRVEGLIDEGVMLGFENYSSRSDGDGKRDRISDLVAKEVEKIYQDTKRILIDNREFLDKIANALIERTTLLMSDVQEIKKTCKLVR